MLPCDSLESVTLRIANAWGVGQKEKNNGVTIGIAPACRKMTIQNGFGIEKIFSNAETKEVIAKYFVPSFKSSDYFKGTLSGVNALIQILTEKSKGE